MDLEVVRINEGGKEHRFRVQQSCVLELTVSLEVKPVNLLSINILSYTWEKIPCLSRERGKLLE